MQDLKDQHAPTEWILVINDPPLLSAMCKCGSDNCSYTLHANPTAIWLNSSINPDWHYEWKVYPRELKETDNPFLRREEIGGYLRDRGSRSNSTSNRDTTS